MFNDSASFFIILFNNVDSLILIGARLIGLMILMPILSSKALPRLGKLGFMFFISILIFTSKFNENLNVEYANSFIGFAIVFFKEFMIGYILGFSVYMVTSSIYFAGQLIDFQLGFSMVSIFDPISQLQLPISGNILSLMITTLLLITGAFDVFLDAVFFSYDKVPIGTVDIFVNETIMQIISNTMVYFLEFGLRIGLPIVGTILVVDVALGLLVKASPQMNVFVVGMPIKVLIGLVMFYLVMPMMLDIFDELFNYSSHMFYGIINGFEVVN